MRRAGRLAARKTKTGGDSVALHVRVKSAGYLARTVAGICSRLDLSICEIA
jgi:hypothetical protein